MLPSRERLQGWDPASLGTAGTTITSAGRDVAGAVTRVDNACQTSPEMNGWAGGAHDAAVAMFGRATTAAAQLSDNSTSVGSAIGSGTGPIGDARSRFSRRQTRSTLAISGSPTRGSC